VTAEDDHVRLALQSLPGVVSVRTEAMPENRRRVFIEGEPDVELRNRVARALVTADIDLFELRAEAISLEDIFLRLTRSDTDTTQGQREARQDLGSLDEPSAVVEDEEKKEENEEPKVEESAPDVLRQDHGAPTLPPTSDEDDE